MTVLGLDTSNYTTSVALFDGTSGRMAAKLLEVPEGALGLRQSDALFQHVKRLPALFGQLREGGAFSGLSAVGASTRPRAAEGSYMPCFLAGESMGRVLADTLGVPFFPCSHQQGHLAAAAWSAGRSDLMDRPHLAWHLSGGTTELLYVAPEGGTLLAQKIGGTTDLSAGQLIDRAGVLLGLSFPAGGALDALACDGKDAAGYPVKRTGDGLFFSLSGVENRVRAMVDRGEAPRAVAEFTRVAVASVVRRVTAEAQARYSGLPVLFSGGVSGSKLLRREMEGAFFAAEPRFAADNAMGVAILALRALEGGVH